MGLRWPGLSEYLQGNVSLVLGPLLALILLGLRASIRDSELRRDLRGALTLLAMFLALRSAQWLLSDHLSPSTRSLLQVGWMMTFAFGVIRSTVALGLWMLRLRRVQTPSILRDVIDVSLYALAAVPILKSQLAIDVTGLLATSAIISIVLGLALQDTLGNLFAGLSLQLERPFQVGDWVTVGQHTGKIEQIAWRATRFRTFKGDTITLPNNLLAKEAVKNFSRGLQPMAVELTLPIGYEHPPNQVKQILHSTVMEIPDVLRDPPPRIKTAIFEEFAIRYHVRFFVPTFEQMDPAVDEAHSRIWYRLRREGMAVPSPVRTLRNADPLPRPELSTASLAELLKSVDLFNQVRPDDLVQVGLSVKPIRFGRGERILRAGDPGETFYLVAEGEVSVRAGTPEREVAKLGRGEYFGEISLLTGEPRAATVLALSDVLLLEFNRAMFSRLFENHPGLAKNLSALLARRRTQLRTHAENLQAPHALEPDAGDILGRLRSIFGLRD